MSKTSSIVSVGLLFSFGMICAAHVRRTPGVHSSAAGNSALAEIQGSATDCSDKAAVVEAIYAHFKKNGLSKQQRERINVRFNTQGKVVILEGFVTPTSRRRDQEMAGVNRAGQLAAEATTCESRVDNKLTSIRGHGCTPPRVACGQTGVCLPPDECNAGKSR